MSLILYSLPGTTSLKAYKARETVELESPIDIEYLDHGFLIAPFNSFSTSTYFKHLIPIKDPERELTHYNFHYKHGHSCSTSEQSFLNNVEIALESMKKNSIEKICLSKISTVPKPNKHPIKLYIEITKSYPNAFTYLISSSKTGVWMGATPELLLEQTSKSIVRTASLAGTKAKVANFSLKKTTWQQKEIEEQNIVTKYITDCFEKLCLREFDQIGPETVEAGHLYHLKTIIEIDNQKIEFPKLTSRLLNLLHPTPATCGQPMEQALKMIYALENHDREYYSGFLGPIFEDKSFNLFVNLRSAQFLRDQIIFLFRSRANDGQ